MGTTTGWMSFGKKNSGFGDQSRPKSAIEQSVSMNNNITTIPVPKIVKTPPNILKLENTPRNPLPLLCEDDTTIITTSIKEAATITIPIRNSVPQTHHNVNQTYKTMPLNQKPLKHSVEEVSWKTSKSTKGLETVARDGSLQQRRTKYNKNYRTASCSSSDASDDDSEGRKKRPPKHMNTPTHKPIPQRRDSHDDSSDSQEQGATSGGGGGGGTSSNHVVHSNSNSNSSNNKQSGDSGSGGGGGGGLTRRHRGGRRACETRLRESQSLNRITEVQEADSAQPPASQRSKGFFHPTRFLHGFGKRPIHIQSDTQTADTSASDKTSDKNNVQSLIRPAFRSQVHAASEEKENCHKIVSVTEKHGFKKVRLFSRYFQVHKKLCLPRLPTFPGLWGRTGRLYKAQSCGSIVRDKITSAGASSLLLVNELCKDKPLVLDSHRARIKLLAEMTPCNAENYISLKSSQQHYSICQIHLGDSSKCCGLC